MSSATIKKVRFATFVDVRYYDADEAILSSYDMYEDEDGDLFYDSVEAQEEEEESNVAFEAQKSCVPTEPFSNPAPKRPLESDDEEATPGHENKRPHIDEGSSSGSGVVDTLAVESSPPPPFEVYSDLAPASLSSGDEPPQPFEVYQELAPVSSSVGEEPSPPFQVYEDPVSESPPPTAADSSSSGGVLSGAGAIGNRTPLGSRDGLPPSGLSPLRGFSRPVLSPRRGGGRLNATVDKNTPPVRQRRDNATSLSGSRVRQPSGFRFDSLR